MTCLRAVSIACKESLCLFPIGSRGSARYEKIDNIQPRGDLYERQSIGPQSSRLKANLNILSPGSDGDDGKHGVHGPTGELRNAGNLRP